MKEIKNMNVILYSKEDFSNFLREYNISNYAIGESKLESNHNLWGELINGDPVVILLDYKKHDPDNINLYRYEWDHFDDTFAIRFPERLTISYREIIEMDEEAFKLFKRLRGEN